MGKIQLIEGEDNLDEALSRPTPELVEFARTLPSPLVILGAAGKMGPSLAVMARRAAITAGNNLDVIAVSRFSEPAAAAWLEQRGVKTIVCDLLDGNLGMLPDASNVIYLVGLKFGTSSSPGATWVMNTIVPARIAGRYAKSRLVALSTGNVYPMSEVAKGGSREGDDLTPLGEYPNSAVGRERVFEFYSRRNGTPMTLLRLFYAVDLRYGVVVDIARKIFANEPIELANGSFNCIWQGDANERIIRALALANSPAAVFNLCHPQICSVRDVAARLGTLLGQEPKFIGIESSTSLVANADSLSKALPGPLTPMDTLLQWTAHWVQTGGRNLGKPTHFETRDGKY